MREFGAVGERELHGCTCVEVEAGTCFAALVAHSRYEHGHVYRHERIGCREVGVGVDVDHVVLPASLVGGGEHAFRGTGKSLALDHHLAAIVERVGLILVPLAEHPRDCGLRSFRREALHLAEGRPEASPAPLAVMNLGVMFVFLSVAPLI